MMRRYVKFDDSGTIKFVGNVPQTHQMYRDGKDGSPKKEYNGILIGHDDRDGVWICENMRVKHQNGDGTVELE